jgi:hypothetical protein
MRLSSGSQSQAGVSDEELQPTSRNAAEWSGSAKLLLEWAILERRKYQKVDELAIPFSEDALREQLQRSGRNETQLAGVMELLESQGKARRASRGFWYVG